MANRTVKEASSIKGTNPQYLVEKIIRLRVYESRYWKEECFALTAELLVDKAVALRYIGGIYGGNVKPTPFMCLLVKMLQIQPEKDIIMEFIRQEDFKYMRLLGAMYFRLTADSLEAYKYLEPLLNDYRKVRKMNKNGHFELTYIDEVIDEMLHGDRIIDITLPRLQKRYHLEENNELDPRASLLDEDLLEEGDKIKAAKDSSSSEDEIAAKRSDGHSSGEKSSESSKDSNSDDDRRHHRRNRNRDDRRRRRSRSRSKSRSRSRHRHKRHSHRESKKRSKRRPRRAPSDSEGDRRKSHRDRRHR